MFPRIIPEKPAITRSSRTGCSRTASSMPTGSGQQQSPGGAQNHERDLSGLSEPRELHRRLGCISDDNRDGARIVVLPAAMWVEKEGAYGNAERRTHVWHQLVNAPGEARSDLWQMMEFPSVSRPTRSGRQNFWPSTRNTGARSIYEVLFRNGNVDKFPLDEIDCRLRERKSKIFRLLCPEGLVRGICSIRPRAWPRSRALRQLSPGARTALAGRQWQGDAMALSRGLRPLCEKRARGWSSTAFRTERRAMIAVPYEPPAEVSGQGIRPWLSTGRVLEHWHSGTMTRRVPELYKAFPGAVCFMHPDDAQKRAATRCTRSKVHLAPRLNPHPRRNPRPQQDAARTRLRAMVRRSQLINKVTLDATDPIS